MDKRNILAYSDREVNPNSALRLFALCFRAFRLSPRSP